jgi:hypothetical protein
MFRQAKATTRWEAIHDLQLVLVIEHKAFGASKESRAKKLQMPIGVAKKKITSYVMRLFKKNCHVDKKKQQFVIAHRKDKANNDKIANQRK